MLALKRIDFYGQAILLILAAALIIANSNQFLIPAYIAVGSWQFLSCLVQFLLRDSLLRQKTRHLFELILVIAPVALLVLLLKPLLAHDISPFIAWLSPVLSIWYSYITRVEMNLWEARALIQLR